MDHNRAVEIQAVERYLLGELAPEERDSFEEHYFDCKTCASDVRIGARFRANAREVLRRGPQFEPERRGGWFSWAALVPVAVSLAAIGVISYQNVVTIPALRAPLALSTPVTLDGATRGSLPEIVEGKPLDLMMPAPAAGDAGVIPELTSESGKVLTRGSAVKPVPDEPFHVYFPGRYSPGRYAVIFREPGTERELGQDKFEIVPKETNTHE